MQHLLSYPEICRRLQEHGAIYGFTVRQSGWDGCVETWSTDGHLTADEARDTAWRMATEDGWTPPRWWQWWRWNDTRPDNTGPGDKAP